MDRLELDTWGAWIVDLILWFAAWLTGEDAPGWVSLALVVALVGLSIWHGISAWRFRRAVKACRANIRDIDGRITHESLVDIDGRFEELKKKKGSWRRLGVAWQEFRETTVEPEQNTGQLQNTVRPTVFFAHDELGIDRGIWRQVPALFVSVGLFLTFLGLVAALEQTSQILDSAKTGGNGATTDGLKTLLRIAGAKFIMSLTGLFCSIVFTLLLRSVARGIDKALHGLCADIEKGCLFLSEQTLLREMVVQAREQTGHLQSFSTELVAQIAKPLQEDLPETIRTSIREIMAPAIEILSQSTKEGIESMADDVSARLARGIQDSVETMNQAIDKMSQGLCVATERLDSSANAMAVTVDSLQKSVIVSAERSGREIERAGQDMAFGVAAAMDTVRGNILDPMNELVDSVRSLSSSVETASDRFDSYSVSVDNSAKSVVSTNQEIERSTQMLARAIAPVRDAVTGIEAVSRIMGDRVEEASSAISRTTQHTEAVMRGTRNAIEASMVTTREALDALKTSVREFKDILDRYGVIDDKLGVAFQRIETAVGTSIEEIGNFQKKLSEEFGSALNRLEAVIAQAEEFVPRQKG